MCPSQPTISVQWILFETVSRARVVSDAFDPEKKKKDAPNVLNSIHNLLNSTPLPGLSPFVPPRGEANSLARVADPPRHAAALRRGRLPPARRSVPFLLKVAAAAGGTDYGPVLRVPASSMFLKYKRNEAGGALV